MKWTFWEVFKTALCLFKKSLLRFIYQAWSCPCLSSRKAGGQSGSIPIWPCCSHNQHFRHSAEEMAHTPQEHNWTAWRVSSRWGTAELHCSKCPTRAEARSRSRTAAPTCNALHTLPRPASWGRDPTWMSFLKPGDSWWWPPGNWEFADGGQPIWAASRAA